MGSWMSMPKRSPGRPRAHILAEHRQPASTSEQTETERYVYFWVPPGAFCNWTLSPFTMRRKRFCCAEQGLMWLKAMLFNDEETRRCDTQGSQPAQAEDIGTESTQF